MDNSRRKAYQRTGNEERIKEIRESLRVRTRIKSDRTSESAFYRKERFRDRIDVQKRAEGAEEALLGDYEGKCNFLNSLNKILMETKLEAMTDNDFFEEICHLMLKFLKDDHPYIRAMCFHILRKCCFNERNLTTLLTTHVDIYVVRAVDLQIENEQERMEAFKLINWMMKIYEKSNLKKLIDTTAQTSSKKFIFPKSIMQPIISIALAAFQNEKKAEQSNGQTEDDKEAKPEDKLTLPCVGLFLEFCLSEPDIIITKAGTDWMVRVLTGLTAMSRRIVVLISHILIAWLDNPHIRVKAALHLVLEQIFAPLVEYGLFQKRPNLIINSSANESFQITDVLENFKFACLSLLRSWPGLFACAAVGPNANIIASSPLRLLEYLGLGTVENQNLVRIRETIVELCCDFVDLPYANKKFESWDEALQFYKTMHLPDKFKSSLKYDFVIAQNDTKMKNDVERRQPTVDLLAAFRCLSQFVLINASLPQSLARLTLAQPDSPSSLKATLLMADMLRTVPSHIPVGWRAPVLSMPTLVQSACESLIQSKASAAIAGRLDLNSAEQYTFIHAENAELILHRFDELNQTWIRSASNSSSHSKESDLFLFVPHFSNPIPHPNLPSAPLKKSKSEVSFRQAGSFKRHVSPDILEEFPPGDFDETVLEGNYNKHTLCLMDDFDDYDYDSNIAKPECFENDVDDSSTQFRDESGEINWNYTEYYIEMLESETVDKVVKEFLSHSIEDHVTNIFSFLLPSEQERYKRFIDKQHVIVVKSIIKTLLRIMPYNDSIKQDYSSVITRYVTNFRAALENRETANSFFTPRNLSYTRSMLHFAIVGTLTSSPIGFAILNDVGILHRYLDMMTSSIPSEYVKLIISSLDYTHEGLTRVILRKALTATNEPSRKWCTRYLSVLASVDLPLFADWGVQLMLRQLADESAKTVRHAFRLLTRWLPEYPSKSVQKIQWSLLGEAGDLLKAHYYSIESECANDEEEVKEVIRYWMKTFNQKYLETIDEEFREVMFSVKRSLDGNFSRASSDRPDTSLGVPAPLHLFAALGSHETGRELLISEGVCDELLGRLTTILDNSTVNTDRYNEVKSSILALASIGSTSGGFAILPVESVPRIIKIAEEHSVLSVRGIAFWACVTLSQEIEGAKRLAMFGWESNKFRYATDLAKMKSNETSSARGGVDEDTAPGSSWRRSTSRRKITHQHHRNSSIAEIQFSAVKQSRAKSESALTRRRTHRRSSSDSRVPSEKLIQYRGTLLELISVQRMWNSEQNLSKYSGQSHSDASSSITYFQSGKRSWQQTQNHNPIPSLKTSEFHIVVGGDDAAMTMAENMMDEEKAATTMNLTPRLQSASFATSKISGDRRRANTVNSLLDDDGSTKTRSSTVARCIKDGLQVPRNQLENEGMVADTIMDDHFSCRLREKYHLSPFQVRSSIQINRNIGNPIRYIFMTKEEERYFANYRKQMVGDSWLFNELKKEDNAVRKTVNVVPMQVVTLPAEIEVMCGNIFASKQKHDSIFAFEGNEDEVENDVEDRGARSGYARSDILIQPHSTYRCFHCKEDHIRTYPHPDAPALRKEVLNQVDMLEIKEYPAKRLIGLRQHHQWLFEWPCLYADVLELLDEYRFKPHSRSFLQQIFYDALQL